MVGVCFYFEDYYTDVFSGHQDLLDAWNYSVGAVGDVDRVVIINKTDQHITFNNRFQYDVVADEAEFLALVGPGDALTYVGCENEFTASINLWDFDHETDWYYFGPAKGHKITGTGVHIPTQNDVVYHSVHAAAIVMHDRLRKVSLR